MSDIFSNVAASLADNPPTFDLPTFAPSDFTFSSAPSGTWADIFGAASGAPILPPVQNLPSTGSTGLTGFINDAANLAASIYKGEAQVAAAQSAGQVAKARTAQQIANLNNQPSPWLILGIIGAGFLALRLTESGPPVQSVVSTTRRTR